MCNRSAQRKSYLLHVVPVCNDAALDGVPQAKDISPHVGLLSDEGVFHRHALAHHRWKYGSGLLISGKTGFQGIRSVVKNQSPFIVVHAKVTDATDSFRISDLRRTFLGLALALQYRCHFNHPRARSEILASTLTCSKLMFVRKNCCNNYSKQIITAYCILHSA